MVNFNVKKKNLNPDSHIAFSSTSQSFFFEEVCCLILASSQRKLHEYIEFLKFDVTIKKIKKFTFVIKFKGLVRFSENLVPHITQYKSIYAWNFSSINWNLAELDNF